MGFGADRQMPRQNTKLGAQQQPQQYNGLMGGGAIQSPQGGNPFAAVSGQNAPMRQPMGQPIGMKRQSGTINRGK